MCANENFIIALTNEIEQVYYCDHVMDNTFIKSRVYETVWELEDRGYTPIGYCTKPEYSPASGIAFVVKDKDDNDIWVHVPKNLFRSWLKQCNIDWVSHPACRERLIQYKEAVINVLQELGATEDEMVLLTEETLQNGLKNNRLPKDVAWAILQ